MSPVVLLIGGPFDGHRVEVGAPAPRTLQLEAYAPVPVVPPSRPPSPEPMRRELYHREVIRCGYAAARSVYVHQSLLGHPDGVGVAMVEALLKNYRESSP